MITMVLENEQPLIKKINATTLENLLGLVTDEQKGSIIGIAVNKEKITPSEVTNAKVAVICKKLKELALTSDQKTSDKPATQQETSEIGEAIKEYVKQLFRDRKAQDDKITKTKAQNDEIHTMDRQDLCFVALGTVNQTEKKNPIFLTFKERKLLEKAECRPENIMALEFLADTYKYFTVSDLDTTRYLNIINTFVTNMRNENQSATLTLQETHALPTTPVVEVQELEVTE